MHQNLKLQIFFLIKNEKNYDILINDQKSVLFFSDSYLLIQGKRQKQIRKSVKKKGNTKVVKKKIV